MDSSHIIVLMLLAATLLVLITGVIVMMKGGPLNDKYGNKLMIARVTLQGLTLLFLGFLFLMGK